MFRAMAQETLIKLAQTRSIPENRLQISDGNVGTLTICVRNGDINLSCSDELRSAGVTFSGSGYHKPLVREALLLLAIAVAEES